MTDTAGATGVLPEFRVGTVLSQTFSTFFSNFPKFFGISVLFYLPVAVFTYFYSDPQAVADMAAGGDFGAMMRKIFLVAILSMAVLAVIQASITYGAIEHQANRTASVTGMLSAGLQAILPVIAASILVSILYMLGAMLLLVPGIIVLVMMSVTTPVIVAEKKGPIAAMGRSRELTKGYKWQVFGVFVVLFVVLYGVMTVGGLLVGLGFADISQQNGNSFTLSLFSLVSTGAYYALISSCVASVYSNLRAAKEGTSADDIAQVFA